jgi:hypothetical protein
MHKKSCFLSTTKTVAVVGMSLMRVTVVWLNGKPQDCAEHVIIKSGHRRGCQRRIAFKHQCCHELCILGKLDLAKYSTWWLNCGTFNASTISFFDNQLPVILPQLNPLIPACHNQAQAVEDGEAAFGDTLGADDDSDEYVPPSQLGGNAVTKDAKLTYQFVAGKASNLVRLAQSDPAALGSLCNLLDQLAGRLRNGQSIDVQAYHTVVPVGKESPGSVPLLGTLRAAPNTYNQRRKIFRHAENRRQEKKCFGQRYGTVQQFGLPFRTTHKDQSLLNLQVSRSSTRVMPENPQVQ